MDGWVIVNFIEVDNYIGCIVTTIQAFWTVLELPKDLKNKSHSNEIQIFFRHLNCFFTASIKCPKQIPRQTRDIVSGLG